MIRQWLLMYDKEMLEMWRNFKWLWIPVVFVLLGAMQPVMTYYMPQILASTGGLPEGAVIEIPMPTGGQMMAEVLRQYGSVGVLILVLAGMAVVSGEKQSRSIGLVLIRPIPYSSFISAKWAGMVTIMLVSLLLGCLAGWYYTELLIGPVMITDLILAAIVYAMWLAFILTVTLFMSTWLKGNSAVAFVTILVAMGFSLLTGLFDTYMHWSPARLSTHATSLLLHGVPGDWFVLNMAATAAAVVGILAAAVSVMKRQELGD